MRKRDKVGHAERHFKFKPCCTPQPSSCSVCAVSHDNALIHSSEVCINSNRIELSGTQPSLFLTLGSPRSHCSHITPPEFKPRSLNSASLASPTNDRLWAVSLIRSKTSAVLGEYTLQNPPNQQSSVPSPQLRQKSCNLDCWCSPDALLTFNPSLYHISRNSSLLADRTSATEFFF